MNGLDSLPPEIIEKIITAPVSTCINAWPNHMVATFNGIRSVSRFFQILADAKTRAHVTGLFLKT